MSGTSATGGYLAPVSPSPAAGDALDDILQAMVAGITGVPDELVRPRWQPTPPNQPSAETDWCALGITATRADTYAYVEHVGAGDGEDRMQRHEEMDVLCSFIGPNSGRLAAFLRDGLTIAQNREAIGVAGLVFVEAGTVLAVPDLVNTQWIRRHDLPLVFRRQINRTYRVLNILSAGGSIQAGDLSTPWNVEP